MQITLTPLDASRPDEQVVLGDLPVTIGRGHEACLRLLDPSVSRKHCEIDELEGRAVVRDLGSTNGTFVNGYGIRSEELLMPEDTLRVGRTRFLVAYSPAVSVMCKTSDLSAPASEDAAACTR